MHLCNTPEEFRITVERLLRESHALRKELRPTLDATRRLPCEMRAQRGTRTGADGADGSSLPLLG